jgi:hypothetical protein
MELCTIVTLPSARCHVRLLDQLRGCRILSCRRWVQADGKSSFAIQFVATKLHSAGTKIHAIPI